MSFGFSVKDIIEAANLLTNIYDSVFRDNGCHHNSFNDFGKQVKGLSRCLKDLSQQLSESLQHITYDVAAPPPTVLIDAAGMIGDFSETIQNIEKLLSASGFQRRTEFARRLEWILRTEQQVRKLTDDCKFHMVKIQFAMKAIVMCITSP
jgi:hypothetical protein